MPGIVTDNLSLGSVEPPRKLARDNMLRGDYWSSGSPMIHPEWLKVSLVMNKLFEWLCPLCPEQKELRARFA